MILAPILKFESARLKLQRADHHIQELEKHFALFIERKPYSLIVGSEPKTGKQSVSIKFNEAIPSWLALILGDALHNLRTALDHMVWEMVGYDGGEQDHRLQFPASDSKTNFEAMCERIKTPSSSVIDKLKALEVFPTGKGESLHTLNALNNADKHRIITPVIRGAKISKLTIFNSDGTVCALLADNEIGGGSGETMLLASVPLGGYVEVDNDMKVTPNISFSHPFGFRQVIPTLHQFRKVISQTLDDIAWKTS